jgi:pimeloyl-ACP methyl ester carboxylesterase
MSNNWIFLRGLTRGNIHWGDFPDTFLANNPDAQVEYLEIPGNGLLFSETTPVDPELLLNILRSKSEFVKNNKKYHLCGISLGGMVALKWAELHFEEIASVTVINTSLSQFSSLFKRLRPKNYSKLFSILIEKDSFKLEKCILEITSNNFDKNMKYLNLFANFTDKHRVSFSNFLRQLILAKNIYIKNFPVNKLKILSAVRDQLVDSTCSFDLAKRSGGTLIIHPTSGHDLPLDDPKWVVDQLMKNL